MRVKRWMHYAIQLHFDGEFSERPSLSLPAPGPGSTWAPVSFSDCCVFFMFFFFFSKEVFFELNKRRGKEKTWKTEKAAECKGKRLRPCQAKVAVE